jgi:hypothetical protein
MALARSGRVPELKGAVLIFDRLRARAAAAALTHHPAGLTAQEGV